jgi:hypothetical protein
MAKSVEEEFADLFNPVPKKRTFEDFLKEEAEFLVKKGAATSIVAEDDWVFDTGVAEEDFSEPYGPLEPCQYGEDCPACEDEPGEESDDREI